MAREQFSDTDPSDEQRLQDLLPLAAELRDSIDRQLTAASAEGGPVDMDRVFDQAFGEVAEILLPERLKELSAQEFAELYGRIRGDEALLQKLEELRVLKTVQLDREVRLARIAQDARISGALHLGRLVAGEAIVIGLFDPEQPHLAAKRFADDQQHRSLHRIIAARVLSPERGYAEILRDSWVGPVWASQQRTDPIPVHARGLFGAEILDEDGTHLEPTISVQSPLSYRFGTAEETTTSAQIVGYVETMDKTLLLDGS